VVFVLLTGGEAARAGEYTDPSGFSFTYPDDWVVVTRPTWEKGKEGLPPEVKNMIAANKIDLNRVNVVCIRKGHDEFLENLNVVVDNQQIPVSDSSVKQLTDGLPQKYGAMGIKVDNVQGRIERVGSREAVVVEFNSRVPGIPFPLRQRQILLPGGGKTYIVTCTARADAFDQYLPVFEKTLASVQVPEPTGKGFDLSQVGKTAVLGAIIGVVVGGLVAIIKMFSGKGRAKRNSAGSVPTDER
jgi:hypothetical protein